MNSPGVLFSEAAHRGSVAPPMAGGNRAQAAEAFELPEDLTIITVIAIGYPGDVSVLSASDQERNHPNERKPIDELLL